MSRDITVRSKMVATRFGKLAVKVDGSAEMPPLLLCQRFRGTMDDRDPEFISRLAVGRQVIRFDSVGIGKSEGETPNTIGGMAKPFPLYLPHWGSTGATFSGGRLAAMLRRRSR
jgi:hypothetical protein